MRRNYIFYAVVLKIAFCDVLLSAHLLILVKFLWMLQSSTELCQLEKETCPLSWNKVTALNQANVFIALLLSLILGKGDGTSATQIVGIWESELPPIWLKYCVNHIFKQPCALGIAKPAWHTLNYFQVQK